MLSFKINGHVIELDCHVTGGSAGSRRGHPDTWTPPCAPEIEYRSAHFISKTGRRRPINVEQAVRRLGEDAVEDQLS